MFDNLENMDLDGLLDDDSFVNDDFTSKNVEDEGDDGIDLGGMGDEVVSIGGAFVPQIPTSISQLQASIPHGSAVQKSLEDPTLDDPLLDSLRHGDPIQTVLNYVLVEIAEEICYLKASRNSNWESDTDFSDISAKRIRSLKSLVESLIEKERLRNSKDTGKIDFQSKSFENVFSHFLKIIEKTFSTVGIPTQYNDIFFTQLAKDLDGFEKDAEKIYYGKKK